MQVTVTELWWPTMGIRALELLERGADLTRGERGEAEREREARKRRESSPPFIRRKQIELQRSSHRGYTSARSLIQRSAPKHTCWQPRSTTCRRVCTPTAIGIPSGPCT